MNILDASIFFLRLHIFWIHVNRTLLTEILDEQCSVFTASVYGIDFP